VFPIAYVIPEVNVYNGSPEVIGVEVEPEGVEDAVAFVYED
jgi:hypothetical protein